MAKTVCSQADIRNPLSLLAHNQIAAMRLSEGFARGGSVFRAAAGEGAARRTGGGISSVCGFPRADAF